MAKEEKRLRLPRYLCEAIWRWQREEGYTEVKLSVESPK